MSRHLNNSRGRQSQLSSTRGLRAKENIDETYSERAPRGRRGGSKYGSTPHKNRKAKPAIVNISDVESSSAEDPSGDEADEEADDESEEVDENLEPAYIAPSRAAKPHVAGRHTYDHADENASDVESDTFPMFEEDSALVQKGMERDEELEARIFDSGDEDIYQAVEGISDSDSDEDELRATEEAYLKEEFIETAADDSEDPSFYLNQIEGMSAYGFGEESDATAQHLGSSQSDDEDATETLERHVRFEQLMPHPSAAFLRLSESPTMARALLPSALPETFTSALTGSHNRSPSPDESDEIDSDATDDALPPEAIRNKSKASQAPVEDEPRPSFSEVRRKGPRRGPPTGTFIDDGEKSAGILDASGKMLIITNPHLLGEEFARRYGPSQPASPSLGFAEAVLDDDNSPQSPSSGESVNNQPADLMLSSLNTDVNTATNGQATGPPEAFFATAVGSLDEYDAAFSMVDGEFNGSDFGEMDEAEKLMNIEDVIDFDSESETGSLTSPIYMPSELSILGNSTELAHLNNNNITAFRRNADPAYAARMQEPTPLRHGQFNTPKIKRKRKAENESPYNHSHYKGVTPVQRMRDPNETNALNSSPVPQSSSKRRRIMT